MYTLTPRFSLSPHSLCLYNEFSNPTADKERDRQRQINPNYGIRAADGTIDHAPLKRKFHNFEISKNAERLLRKKMIWLFYLSRAKQIITYSGKKIHNFRLAFITLTLPAAQKSPTKEITENLLNQFLTELRQRTKIENYVWRLEFQKNGNVHYHLVTDTYIDYFLIKQLWNKNLEKLGYISDYQTKFENMTFREYAAYSKLNPKTEFQAIKDRYARGVRSNWRNPNSVDVKVVTNKRAAAAYMSKYFTKNPEGQTICNQYDTPENSKTMRLWFCSRSLSKLNSISDYTEAFQYDLKAIISSAKKVKKVVMDYCTMYYFDTKDLCREGRGIIEGILQSYVRQENYQPSG